MRQFRFLSILMIAVLSVACSGGKGKSAKSHTLSLSTESRSDITIPAFDADSAYAFVKAQTDFGPRVPNTEAHRKCAQYLTQKLRSFGIETMVQNIQVTTFDGVIINGYNIIGRVNPDNPARVIVCAHWDSRPWADNDPDPKNHKTPIDGADDGASGVGVILELARQFQQKAPGIGVDLIFFDAEDWGPGDDYKGSDTEDFWGLGTQYWARIPHVQGYFARYAVLLDMVGNRNARFYREGVSLHFAKNVVNKYWSAAIAIGHGDRFIQQNGGFVTDDHYYINMLAGIPAIDIIPYYPDNEQSSFGPTWHTVSDNIDNIDKGTLKTVGETLLYVLYNEK